MMNETEKAKKYESISQIDFHMDRCEYLIQQVSVEISMLKNDLELLMGKMDIMSRHEEATYRFLKWLPRAILRRMNVEMSVIERRIAYLEAARTILHTARDKLLALRKMCMNGVIDG